MTMSDVDAVEEVQIELRRDAGTQIMVARAVRAATKQCTTCAPWRGRNRGQKLEAACADPRTE